MKRSNMIWGIFFILIAGVIILKQTGFLIGVNLISLVITLLLIPVMLKSIRYLNFSGILFSLAIVGILYAEPLGIQNFVPWPILGVALFLSIGLSLIFPKYQHMMHEKWKTQKEKDFEEGFSEIIDEPDESEVKVFTKFGASVKYINSDKLKKVNLGCSFGAMKLYLDRAEMEGNEAVLNCDIEFAGVEIYIPKEWKIQNKINNVASGIEVKGNMYAEKQDKTLTIVGKSRFAGVTLLFI